MRTRLNHKLLRVSLVVLLVSSLFVNVLATGEGVPNGGALNNSVGPLAATSKYPKNPKMDSLISELVQIQKSGVSSELSAFIASRDLDVSDEKIQVVLVMDGGPQSLSRYAGLEVEAQYKDLIRALVPISMIDEISEDPKVQYLRMPLRPHPAVVSEGRGVINADALQAMGVDGTGVKVAVIDAGFNGYDSSPEIWNVVEAVSFTGDITGGGEEHGSGCAEIILDVAPNVSLYLYNINDSIDFGNAVNRAITQGVDIISCSLGWFNAGPYDGTGLICDITNTSNASGILFVNSAGNQAKRHYEGTFSDIDTNGSHEFDGSSDEFLNLGTVDAGYPITLYLSWDDWVAVDQDYDLYLLDGTFSPVTASKNPQTGSGGQSPTESIGLYAPSTDNYHVAIKNYSSRGDTHLELYSFYNNFAEYGVSSSSLLIPADAESVLAVGATYWGDDSLETFSSRGPTNDGRIKPDVCAPDGVTSSFYPSKFYGTSASAPHTAGAAALLLDAKPTLDNTELKYHLESSAVDLDAFGKDNRTGSGRIDVYASYLAILAAESVHNLNTGEKFTTIQAAIDDSDTTNGHVIEADPGTYLENIVVDKSLTIHSSSGDPADTIVKAADPAEHLINITTDYVNLSGLTIMDTNAGLKAGVYLGSGISNCNISQNYVSNNSYSGIYLDGSSNNTILGNDCTNNSYGIRLAGALSGSDNNTLTENNASGNLLFDFYSDEKSGNNEIINFTISGYPTTISFTYGDGIKIKATDSAPSDPSSYASIGRYVNATNVTSGSWLTLNVSYNDSDIAGVNESTLRMLRYNSTNWSEVNGSGVNMALNYVYANITEFSTFAPMGIPLLNITYFNPSSNVSDFIGSTRSFNLYIDQSVNVSWLLNGSQVQVNTTVTSANYTNTSAVAGIWNITAVANNQYDEDQQTWIWNVTEDTTGPTISNLSPQNGSFLNGSTHLISANFTDASGINTSLTTIYVNSVDVTSNATNTSSYLVYNQSSNYSDGLHNVTVSVTDGSVNQNNASVTWNFTVDNVAPQTNITSGPSGTIDYNDPSFVWTGSDNTTQSSALQYSYKLGGSWSGWTTDTSKSYTDLSNGDYTFSVKARDQAGNEDQTSAIRSFSVSVPSPPVTPTGGGGGGGGGGASPSGNVQTDSAGNVKSTAVISSRDEGSMITISEGTTALDANGKALKLVTISPISLGGTISAFNFGPEGATFVPDATITITFDPNDLSKEDTVVIKIFDGVEWTSLKTSVDFTKNMATAKVPHFSIFALFIEGDSRTQVMPAFTTGSQVVTSASNNSSTFATPNEVSSSSYLDTLRIVALLALICAAVIGVYFHRKNEVRGHLNEHN